MSVDESNIGWEMGQHSMNIEIKEGKGLSSVRQKQKDSPGEVTWKRNRGTVVDVLSAGLLILAMTILMTSYLGSMQLMSRKSEIRQLARKYILRMETIGCLTENDQTSLIQELLGLGVEDADLSGTTMSEVGYGNPVILVISGSFGGQETVTENGILDISLRRRQYEFAERLMSTAKN